IVWQRIWSDARTGRTAALSDGAVTEVTTNGHVKSLSIDRIARRSAVLRGREGGASQGSRQHHGEQGAHRSLHQRPCDTTSTSAGSPRLTTATAFFRVGPRSLGSVTGPNDATPRPLATVA